MSLPETQNPLMTDHTRSFLKLLLGLALPLGLYRQKRSAPGALWIVCYHDVRDETSRPQPQEPSSISVGELTRHVRMYKKYFRVRRLTHALRELEAGGLDTLTLALTFDDGYASFASRVVPLLEAEKVPATVFVSGSACARELPLWRDALTALWQHRRHDELKAIFRVKPDAGVSLADLSRRAQASYSDSLRDRLIESYSRAGYEMHKNRYMTSGELHSLPSDNVEIGNHTWSHAPVAALDEKDFDREVLANDAYLRQFPAFAPVLSFPFGQQKHFHAWQVRRIRDRMGLFACSSYGGINAAPSSADYLRMGAEAGALELRGQILLEAWRNSRLPS